MDRDDLSMHATKAATALALGPALVLCMILTALLMHPERAAAQLCGMQYVNGQDLDYGPCPNQSNNQPAPPARDLYTAVAISKKTLAMGYSYESTTLQGADQVALSECRSQRGGTDCTVVNWARNQCLGVALSHSDVTWAVDAGTNPFAAGMAALRGCRSAGGKACTIAVMTCSNTPPTAVPGSVPGIQLRR
jgi:hypothetical protein